MQQGGSSHGLGDSGPAGPAGLDNTMCSLSMTQPQNSVPTVPTRKPRPSVPEEVSFVCSHAEHGSCVHAAESEAGRALEESGPGSSPFYFCHPSTQTRHLTPLCKLQSEH